ncbi:hypothetical protein BGW80DRAFT_1273009 [Lactifluus volemus]|nr:hypothetical protein BGW80DRAFT_1273009 [Lactifluus volemus]
MNVCGVWYSSALGLARLSHLVAKHFSQGLLHDDIGMVLRPTSVVASKGMHGLRRTISDSRLVRA